MIRGSSSSHRDVTTGEADSAGHVQHGVGSTVISSIQYERRQPMAYVIAEPCIGVKDTACVDACPVDCIHPKKDTLYEDGRPAFNDVEQLYIDPVECIDCGACVPVCPVAAIFAVDDLPEKWHAFTEVNANYAVDGKFQADKFQK